MPATAADFGVLRLARVMISLCDMARVRGVPVHPDGVARQVSIGRRLGGACTLAVDLDQFGGRSGI
jgi:hypothetical protein